MGKKCTKCKKIGHFQEVCRSRRPFPNVRIHNVELQSPSASTCNSSVSDCTSKFSSLLLSIDEPLSSIDFERPLCQASIHGKSLQVMADSGAPITVPANTTFYNSWGHSFSLQAPDIFPKAFGEKDIELLGFFVGTLQILERSTETKIYIAVKGRDLVGWKDLAKLGIILKSGHKDPIVLGDTPLRSIDNSNFTKTDPLTLLKNNFPSVFKDRIGTIKGFEHVIRLQANATPVTHKVRPVPIAVKPDLKKLFEKLTKDGVITTTDSSGWVSPIVLSKKKNGDLRLCVDLRSLNRNIIIDCHPLPHIQEMLSNIGHSKYFSTIDLHSASHQMALNTDSQELTTFVTPFGAYKYLRLPFGLASAASVFQKVMDVLFKDVTNVQAFQDDILVFTETKEAHLDTLHKVFSILNARGITIQPDKCKFLVEQIDYLGHTITPEGIKPKFSNVEAIIKAPPLPDKDALRSFLCLCEY